MEGRRPEECHLLGLHMSMMGKLPWHIKRPRSAKASCAMLFLLPLMACRQARITFPDTILVAQSGWFFFPCWLIFFSHIDITFRDYYATCTVPDVLSNLGCDWRISACSCNSIHTAILQEEKDCFGLWERVGGVFFPCSSVQKTP